MNNLIIQARNISKIVPTADGQLTILNDISLQLQAGGSVAISGASGSGKSTLLTLLAGLDKATSGSIILDGQELATMDEDQLAMLRAGRVGFVFQNFQLLPHLSALENVMLPLEFAGNCDTRNARQAATAALKRVYLDERLHHSANQLSGGEQQRVAIARAYAGNPGIVFADEPTSNLDHVASAHIADLLFELCSGNNCTLIMVTHDLELARRCDRHFTLTAGTLKQVATGEDSTNINAAT